MIIILVVAWLIVLDLQGQKRAMGSYLYILSFCRKWRAERHRIGVMIAAACMFSIAHASGPAR
jgi:hypothetical protein